MTVAKPTKGTHAKHTIAFLMDVFCVHGLPRIITGDRGELKAKPVKNFCARLGLKVILTSTANPKANGSVERGHKENSRGPKKMA